MNEFRTSLFYDKKEGIYNPKPIKEINLRELIAIYQSEWLRNKTEELHLIRKLGEVHYKELKLQLPMFTPYGTFLPSRSNDNLSHYNSQIIAFDFDCVDDATHLRDHLSRVRGCVVSVVSPSRNGVKALFNTSYKKTAICQSGLLKDNLTEVCKKLSVLNYILCVDIAQFKVSQGMLMAYDQDGFFNENAEILELELEEYKPKEYDKPSISLMVDSDNSRVKAYIRKKTGSILSNLLRQPKGHRHQSIFEISKIKSDLHYIPELEQEIKAEILRTLDKMFQKDGTKVQNDAKRYLSYCWGKANARKNDKIELIIKELEEIKRAKAEEMEKAKLELIIKEL